jgi:hypothetical protein
MTMKTVYGLIALVALGAFAAFAFRQGMRVPPSGRDPNDYVPPPPPT